MTSKTQKMVSMSSLVLNEQNPRNIRQDALDTLAESIRRDPDFLKLRPIIIDEANVIIGGNKRFLALRQLGYGEIPAEWVRQAVGLTQEQRDRFVVVDNAPEGMSGYWDYDMLALSWTQEQLEELGFVFPEEIDATAEYAGMPEHSPEATFVRALRVQFETVQDFEHFCMRIGMSIGPTTKTIWFPEKKKAVLTGVAMVAEQQDAAKE